jgi:hypothetical protein
VARRGVSAQAKRIDPLSPGRFEIFGLDITCGAQRVVFSSDLGSPADLMPVLAAPCDVLVCELSHYLPEELFSVLQGRTIRHLLFNHLAPELNGREVGLLRGAREALPQINEITAVDDGERIRF